MPNKDTIDYVNGKKNVTKDEFIIGREKAGNSELIIVSLPDSSEPLYTFWHRVNAREHVRIKKDESGEFVIEKVQPKGTGGELAYVMLMETCRETTCNLSLESKAVMFELMQCLEWNTCRIIDSRSKRPLTVKDIAKKMYLGLNKAKKVLKELNSAGLVYYNTKNSAYYISQKVVRKGMRGE